MIVKHVVTVRADFYDQLEKNVEEKIQELQNNGSDIVNVSIGGRGTDSLHDWVALILHDEKK
jgi:hypothetical protein